MIVWRDKPQKTFYAGKEFTKPVPIVDASKLSGEELQRMCNEGQIEIICYGGGGGGSNIRKPHLRRIK